MGRVRNHLYDVLITAGLVMAVAFAQDQQQQQAPIQDYNPVTDERLLNPEPENWLNNR